MHPDSLNLKEEKINNCGEFSIKRKSQHCISSLVVNGKEIKKKNKNLNFKNKKMLTCLLMRALGRE